MRRLVLDPAAKAFAIAKLRPVMEPLLQKPGNIGHTGVLSKAASSGLDWKSLVPMLELLDSVEELEAALADPDEFLQTLAAIVV